MTAAGWLLIWLGVAVVVSLALGWFISGKP